MEIKLYNTDKVAIIDVEVYDKIKLYNWYLSKAENGYVQAWKNRKTHLMHRLILKPNKNIHVDHINGNVLDNRKSNLRECTHSQNMSNRKIHKNNKSGYKGVYWSKSHEKWRSQIRKNNKRFFLGYFSDLIEAAKAYNKAAIKYHGEFARLNKI